MAPGRQPQAHAHPTTDTPTSPPHAIADTSAAVAERTVIERMRSYFLLFGLLVLVTAALLFLQDRHSSHARVYVASAGELQMLSQQIAKSAQLSLLGSPTGFVELRDASTRFRQLLDRLSGGGVLFDNKVPPSPERVQPVLQRLHGAWQETELDARWLLNEAETLRELNRSVRTINAFNPLLLDLTEIISEIKLERGATAHEIALANNAVMLTQRLAKNANSLLAATTIDPEAAYFLGRDARMFSEHLTELHRLAPSEPEIQTRLRELEWFSEETLAAVEQIDSNMSELVTAKQAGTRIFQAAPTLLAQTRELSDAYDTEFSGFNPLVAAIIASGLLSLLVIARIARAYNVDLQQRRAHAEELRQQAEDERNQAQEAILRLMNEMGDLADGDLTIRASVTEDITGAIADTVNYTVEELSVLVSRINDAALRVTTATESAQHTSTELLAATERQAGEIKDTGSTVQHMAASMTASSERALQSAQVARQSRDAAQKGSAAVANTLNGMNDLREQIQETSKRIKRLGESSQEIGEIVELISDITEQTNVLALNAAIQAASAGEAGRGFTVVAEEVQRLAERSGEATKQIASIVKSIQTDTKDAVGAMESATRNVVEGAQLTDAASQALAEIENVSTETATLIERISAEIQHHAAGASRVAETMKEILAITDQTTRGTQQTTVSVGQLSDLASELKGSVSGFKV